ncbi:MAG: glycoside hydrolase family 2 TIM barrel-domain containing protein [Clostridia bacterium]
MIWKLGHSASETTQPENWIDGAATAEVAVIYQEKGLLPDYHLYSNFREYNWMEDKWWHYVTSFFVENKKGQTPVLKFLGLDYQYNIHINDILQMQGEGMFTPVDLDLSAYVGSEVNVRVLFHPIPKKVPEEGPAQAAAAVKPAVAYGWDFHPRLVPTGFYDDVVLTYVPVQRIEDVSVDYFVADDLSQVTGELRVSLNSTDGVCAAEIVDAHQTVVCAGSAHGDVEKVFAFVIEDPKLWWCVGHGAQNFYTLKVVLKNQARTVIDSYAKRIGFRKVELVMNEGAWEGEAFPKTQAKVPITIQLNGKKIFAKGTNLTPNDMFGSKLTPELYQGLLTLVKDCNMNIVRMWGGGIVNKEAFFALCDEMGIMVWQEFPLACNKYDNDDNYLRVLDRESRAIISRLKKHPSVVLWCGGNELFCSWSGMTNQSHALRLLDRNCFEMDRHTPFLATSPLYGMGHGNYLPLNDNGTEVMTDFIHSDFTAYTEFGMPAPASADYIRSIIAEKDFENFAPGTDWEVHAAMNSWDKKPETWFCKNLIRHYFGKESDFEQLVDNGQTLQAEVYKNLFEEMRRKWPRNSMALNWCFNEPWPTAANNSLVSYPLTPKPGYYGVKRALQDELLTVKIEKMIWNPGETCKCEIVLLNDHLVVPQQKTFHILVTTLNGRHLAKFDGFEISGDAVAVQKIAAFEFEIKEDFPHRFLVKVVRDGLENEYLLFHSKGVEGR